MTKLEAAAIRWHEYVLAQCIGKHVHAALHLKQHFDLVEQIARMQRPDLYATETTEQKK